MEIWQSCADSLAECAHKQQVSEHSGIHPSATGCVLPRVRIDGRKPGYAAGAEVTAALATTNIDCVAGGGRPDVPPSGMAAQKKDYAMCSDQVLRNDRSNNTLTLLRARHFHLRTWT